MAAITICSDFGAQFILLDTQKNVDRIWSCEGSTILDY